MRQRGKEGGERRKRKSVFIKYWLKKQELVCIWIPYGQFLFDFNNLKQPEFNEKPGEEVQGVTGRIAILALGKLLIVICMNPLSHQQKNKILPGQLWFTVVVNSIHSSFKNICWDPKNCDTNLDKKMKNHLSILFLGS